MQTTTETPKAYPTTRFTLPKGAKLVKAAGKAARYAFQCVSIRYFPGRGFRACATNGRIAALVPIDGDANPESYQGPSTLVPAEAFDGKPVALELEQRRVNTRAYTVTRNQRTGEETRKRYRLADPDSGFPDMGFLTDRLENLEGLNRVSIMLDPKELWNLAQALGEAGADRKGIRLTIDTSKEGKAAPVVVEALSSDAVGFQMPIVHEGGR